MDPQLISPGFSFGAGGAELDVVGMGAEREEVGGLGERGGGHGPEHTGRSTPAATGDALPCWRSMKRIVLLRPKMTH
mgnify:CR=1 FL=1